MIGMAADGTISFDISLNLGKIKTAVSDAAQKVNNEFTKAFSQVARKSQASCGEIAKAFKKVPPAVDETRAQIDAILSDAEKSMKSKASSIAWIYRKQGMNQSDAMKKAWTEIERTSRSSSGKIKKDIEGIGYQGSLTAGELNAGLSGVIKKAGIAMLAAFSVKKAVDFSAQCIELGSDLAEVQNVVDVTFPRMSKRVDEFAKNAISSFGLSETMAKQFTGTFGAMAKAFGFGEKQAYEMSTALTGLAGDVASFYNIDQNEAYTKLKSVFSGETETLKDLGIVMTQSALDAYALANGYGKITSAMSEMEKVALRYAFVQDQLSLASGDFIRTSDGWANQIRVLKLQFDSLKATIGQGLINVLTPVIQVINTIIGKLMSLANAFKAFTELIAGKSSGSGVSAGLNAVAGAAENAENAASSAGSAASKAAKDIKGATTGIDELNIIQPPDSSDSGGGVGAGGYTVDTFDMGEITSPTEELDTRYQKLADTFKRAFEPLKNIDTSNLTRSFKELKEAIAPFTKTLFSGLRWGYDNVFVPFAKWTVEKALPEFLDLIAAAIRVLSEAIRALQPLWQWIWDHFLVPIVSWTGGVIIAALGGLATALNGISDWIKNHQGAFTAITTVIAAFFAVWKGTEIAEFVINAGGVLGLLGRLKAAFMACTVAKIADKAETASIVALYAKDFVVSVTQSISALVKQAAQFAINTAAKTADAVAQAAMTAATVAWNAVCTVATALTTAFGAAVAFLTSPIGLVVVAITGLIAAGVLLYKHWDEVSEYASRIWSGIHDTITTLIERVKAVVSEKLSVIEANWKRIWNAVSQFLNQTWNGILSTVRDFTGWVQDVINKALEAIQTAWSLAWNAVLALLNTIWNKIQISISAKINSILQAVSGFTDGMKQAFQGLLDFISGVFTGDWSKAWEGVKDIFKGIFNGIVSLLESAMNYIVSGINRVLDGINEVVGAVGDVIGLNLKIPTMKKVSLPRLAQGGFVRANTPQLAMIGDNRRYGEIVAPEDKMQEMVDRAVAMAAQMNSGMSDQYLLMMIELLKQIIELIEAMDLTVNIDIREIKKKLTELDKRSGYTLRTT